MNDVRCAMCDVRCVSSLVQEGRYIKKTCKYAGFFKDAETETRSAKSEKSPVTEHNTWEPSSNYRLADCNRRDPIHKLLLLSAKVRLLGVGQKIGVLFQANIEQLDNFLLVDQRL